MEMTSRGSAVPVPGLKTVRSHLPTTDLAALAATGNRPAGPSPLPPAHPGAALEVDRTVSQGGLVSLGKYRLLAAEILAGHRISIRSRPPR